MITVSTVYLKSNGAVCLVHDGFVKNYQQVNLSSCKSTDEAELTLLLIGLKQLNQYVFNAHCTEEWVTFESNQRMFCQKWLYPSYSMDIPTDILPLFKELISARESIPMQYHFSASTNPFALKYLGESYKAVVKVSGFSSLLTEEERAAYAKVKDIVIENVEFEGFELNVKDN